MDVRAAARGKSRGVGTKADLAPATMDREEAKPEVAEEPVPPALLGGGVAVVMVRALARGVSMPGELGL